MMNRTSVLEIAPSELERAIGGLRLEAGFVTDGDGNMVTDEAILFFQDDDGSYEIKILAENASLIALRIERLWNASTPNHRDNE